MNVAVPLNPMLQTLFSRLFDAEGAARGAVWDGGAGAGVLVVDDRGRIRGLSEEAPRLIGKTRRDAIGSSLADLFSHDDRDSVARALSLGTAASPVRVRLARHPESMIDLRCGRTAGRRVSVLLVAAEPALAPAIGQTPTVSPAPALNDGQALGDVSHEMRTPLNAVIGFADAMLSETYGPLGHAKYEEYAGIIRASGRHLLDLVNSALDLARLDAGRYVLKRETVDVGALIRECAALVRLDAEKAGLRIDVRIADWLPEAPLDPRALRQVLINLLSNAIKFTSDGSISLEARAESGELVLTVTDTGVGMAPAELAKLGARYASKGADGVRGAKGTGLGLTLAFALIELHGGVLRFASAPGEGMRAEARLPIVKAAAPARRLRSVQCSESIGGNAQHPPAVLTELERVEAYRRERARSAA
ncbi:MAG: ATP-binding protein [Parvularculaceae bacterium]